MRRALSLLVFFAVLAACAHRGAPNPVLPGISASTPPVQFNAQPNQTPSGALQVSPPPSSPCSPPCQIAYLYNYGDSATMRLTVHGFNKGTFTFASPNWYCNSTNTQTDWSATYSPASFTSTTTLWVTRTYLTLSLVNNRKAPCFPIGGIWSGYFTYACASWLAPNCTGQDGNDGGLAIDVTAHATATPQTTPTPGLDIYDFATSQIVTAATPPAIVGQQQNFAALAAQPQETLSNCVWNIGGATVGSYDASGTAPSATVTTSPYITFYWLSSGTNSASTPEGVSVSCNDQVGSRLTASATYTVQQPVFTASASYAPTSDIQVFYNGYAGNPGIFIAYPTGADWNYAITNAPAAQGSIAMTQIVTTNSSETTQTPNGPVTGPLGNQYNACLDGSFPYAPPVGAMTTWSSSDGPGQQVTNSFSAVTIAYSFKDYFMYQPPDRSSQELE